MANTDPNFEKTQITAQPNAVTEGEFAATQITGETKPKQAKAAATESKKVAHKKKSSKKVTQIGDFKILKKLGQGGMGEVYLANQISLDRKVAFKTLSKEFAKNKDFLARFVREAKSMAKIDHPNIVKCFSAGRESGITFAAIEFIDGQSMQDWMDELKQLSVADAGHVLVVCCEALKHAHDLNLVHRDIKPDNILVTKDGAVKVADFGLAKAMDDDMSVTQSGTGLGTPLFMAPEQVKDAKRVDQRSDIYALGSTFYYFVTGKYPFMGENAMELLIAKDRGQYTSARRVNSAVPERLDLIIDKMMMKHADHRYKNCGEILRDLEKLGIAGESLSFIQSDKKVALKMTSATTGSMTSAMSQAATQQFAANQERARIAAEQKKKSDSKKWFVRHKNPKGKMIISEMSTDQIVRGLELEALDPKATIAKNPTEKFVSLERYPAFGQAVQNRLEKMKANKAKDRLKSMYRWWNFLSLWWGFKRWFMKTAKGVWGITSLILYLGSIVGGIYFGFKYWREIWASISGLIGS